MGFDEEKALVVARLESGEHDRSSKGSVDEGAWPVIRAVNAHPDLFTTSSCSGRIMLLKEPASGKKHEAEWLFVSHDEVASDELAPALAALPPETVWFRMEGAIFHVRCRSLESAEEFLQACRRAGWKHSGVTGTRSVVVEATTSERVDVPVAKDGALLVDGKFVAYLVSEANKKLLRTKEKLRRLAAEF